MKRNDAFQSKHMAQSDVPTPRVLTIADVVPVTLTGDNGEEEHKSKMVFAERDAKPLIVNFGNWMVCEEAFGDDSDQWRGRKIEVYVDPNVLFGKRRVGGLRLRIPSANSQSPPAAQAPATPYWTFQQAVENCEKHNISKDQMIAHLKQLGLNSYNGLRDTVTVQGLIRSVSEPPMDHGFDEDGAPTDASVPF